MRDIKKPFSIPESQEQADRALAIYEIVAQHAEQLASGMTGQQCVMPLLKVWQKAYADQGVYLGVDEVLIILIRATYPDLLKLEASQ